MSVSGHTRKHKMLLPMGALSYIHIQKLIASLLSPMSVSSETMENTAVELLQQKECENSELKKGTLLEAKEKCSSYLG
jgi:hypothetical protein